MSLRCGSSTPRRGHAFGGSSEQSVQGVNEAPDLPAAQREPPRHADEPVRPRAGAQRAGEQGAEVAEIPGDDDTPLVGLGGKVHTVRSSPQIVALPHREDVVPTDTQLPGDLGREVLVEQQPQVEMASRAARHFASSRSLSWVSRAVQSSISS